MLDIKWIIKNQEIYFNNLKKRESYDLSFFEDLISLDLKRRELIQQIEILNNRKNEIAKILSSKEKVLNFEEFKLEAKEIRPKTQNLEQELLEIERNLNDILLKLPNILDDTVPFIENKLENIEVYKFLEPKKFNFEIKDHLTIGENLKMLDPGRAVKMSGSRFMISSNLIAKLERALQNFFLDHCAEFGYTEYSIPYLISKDSALRAGQLPKFEEEIFKTTDGKYLISTSEMAIANLYADEFLDLERLPIRICSFSPCFRSEAGSAGRDIKGLIRLHQFNKVETFCITKAGNSEKEHERMIDCSEELLKKLELPYRKMLLCTQDTSFCAAKTYDLEVWFPTQNTYREIASCSNTKDFQSRRANIKIKTANGVEFIHMLNASCLPIGRTLAAIIENYQNSDNSFNVPEILIPYMNGVKKIS